MVVPPISPLFPLSLLVVAALANVSRKVALTETANEAQGDVFFLQTGPLDPFFRLVFELSLSSDGRLSTTDEADRELSDPAPKPGRFNHIHAFNSLLLADSLMDTAALPTQPTPATITLQ